MPTSTPGAIWNWTGPPKACGPFGPTGPNGTTAKAIDRRDDRDHRRQDVEGLRDVARDHVLLQDHLGAVGQRLEQPEGTDPVRPEPVLREGRDLPLDEDQVGDRALRDPHHQADLDQDAEHRPRRHLAVPSAAPEPRSLGRGPGGGEVCIRRDRPALRMSRISRSPQASAPPSGIGSPGRSPLSKRGCVQGSEKRAAEAPTATGSGLAQGDAERRGPRPLRRRRRRGPSRRARPGPRASGPARPGVRAGWRTGRGRARRRRAAAGPPRRTGAGRRR